MNVITDRSIDLVLSHFEGLKTTMRRILAQFHADLERAEEAAARYKDEKEELTRRKSALVSTARNEISTAEERFRSSVKRSADTMRKEALTALKTQPRPDFVSQLKLYNEFCIAPTKIETEALIDLCGDSITGLSMLNVVLKKTNAGISVNCVTPADIERDLAFIDRLASNQSHYIPTDFTHEGVEIFGGTPVVYTMLDGSTYVSGTWDIVRVVTAEGGFREDIEKIESMRERWKHVSYPTIEEVSAQADPENTETSPSATLEETPVKPYNDTEKEAAEIRAKFVNG